VTVEQITWPVVILIVGTLFSIAFTVALVLNHLRRID
jgi:hypothetical protein